MSSKEFKVPLYKYVLYGGNNPTIIQECLAARKVWVQILPEKILSANFIWKPLNFSHTLYNDIDELLRYDKDHHVFP